MRRRLLYMTDAVNFGGAENYLLSLIGGAVADFEVTLALPARAETEFLISAAEELGARVEPAEILRGRDPNPRGVARAGRFLRRLSPDIVHFNLGSPRRSAEAIVAARIVRIPRRIATIHLAPTPDTSSVLVGAVKRLNRRARFGCLTHAITVSKSNRDALVRDHQVPHERLFVVPNGIDTLRFVPRTDDGVLRAAWGVPRSAPVLGLVARLTHQKGHAVLISAMGEVWKRFPDAHVVLVGTGELEAALRAQADREGGAGRVVFAGYSSEPEKVMNAIDVLMLPSLFEGMPLTALEAMSAEVPVIASAVGGVPEIVRDGETGLLVPPGDGVALARAIEAMLADSHQRARMGAAGRTLVLGSHDVAAMVARTLSYYV